MSYFFKKGMFGGKSGQCCVSLDTTTWPTLEPRSYLKPEALAQKA